MVKIPAERWTEMVKDLHTKCQSIIKSSESVRYAGAINTHGRTLAGALRPGTGALLSADNARNEFFMLSTLMGLREPYSKEIGKQDHAIIYHKKVTIILIRKRDTMFYITTDSKEKDVNEIVQKIKRLI